MKQPKTTRNKNGENNFDFKNTVGGNEKGSPRKRKMTEDQDDVDAGRLTSRKQQEQRDKISISPVSSDDDGIESSTNTIGFVPKNQLGKSNKQLNKSNTSNKLNKGSSYAKNDKPK